MATSNATIIATRKLSNGLETPVFPGTQAEFATALASVKAIDAAAAAAIAKDEESQF